MKLVSCKCTAGSEGLKKVIEKQKDKIRSLEHDLKLSKNSRDFGLERLIIALTSRESEERVRSALENCCKAKSPEFVLQSFKRRFVDTFRKYASASAAGVTMDIQVGTAKSKE